MAGIDGIKGKISPGESENRDLYQLSEEEKENISALPLNLTQAISALKEDNKFLQQGGVFSQGFIKSYIDVVSPASLAEESAA